MTHHSTVALPGNPDMSQYIMYHSLIQSHSLAQSLIRLLGQSLIHAFFCTTTRSFTSSVTYLLTHSSSVH
jgi:hypothetical protein